MPCAAQNYPNGPLRIVSPYPPGGGTDILSRTIGQKLNERLNLPVVVENRAGANGTVGAAFVAKSAPDGHTMLIVPAGYAANPALYKSLPYDQSRELAPVSHLASGPLVLVVHPSLPVKSVKELIALAKAQPGALNVGSAGNGSLPHLCAELFNSSAGIKIVHIPFKGSGAAVIDVLERTGADLLHEHPAKPAADQAPASCARSASPVRKRSPIAPDLPAIAEAGRQGFRHDQLVRPAGAGRHAARHRQQAAAGSRARAQPARAEGAAGRRRHDGGRQHARAVRRIPRARNRQVQPHHPVGRPA